MFKAMKKPTIHDLARLAGVSKTTVSHAFSGRRHVDPQTRDRIEELAQQIGYRPNLAAQRLRTGRTGMIALASSMPFSVAAGPSRLGFLMEIAASAAMASLTRNKALCLIPPLSMENSLHEIAVDGVIVVEPFQNDPIVEHFCTTGVPIVSIGRVPGQPEIPHVDLRSGRTAQMMLQHLTDAGARHIGLVTGAQRRNSYVETEEVYASFCEETGRRSLALRLDEVGGEEESERRCTELLTDHPEVDALFVSVDAFASGAVTAAMRLGTSIPGSLKIATRYNGLRAKLSNPPLTAMDLRLELVAEIAVDMLVAVIDGGKPENVPAPLPILVRRSSTELLDEKFAARMG